MVILSRCIPSHNHLHFYVQFMGMVKKVFTMHVTGCIIIIVIRALCISKLTENDVSILISVLLVTPRHAHPVVVILYTGIRHPW